METHIQALLKAFADLRKKANVSAVFGKPVVDEGRTVIPVGEVAYDFEIGVEQEADGEVFTGGGGDLSVRPLALLELTEDSATLKPVLDERKLVVAGTFLTAWVVFWVTRALVKILGRRE